MIKQIVSLAILISCFFAMLAASPTENEDLEKFDWLLGDWQRQTKSGKILFEKWAKVSPHTFEGISYFEKDGEDKPAEFLRLSNFGSEIYYTAKVPENKFPVAFKLVESSAKRFVFQNETHDFPQQIIYMRKDEKNLTVRISTIDAKEAEGIYFDFKRVKK